MRIWQVDTGAERHRMLVTTNPQRTLWETVLPPGYRDLPARAITLIVGLVAKIHGLGAASRNFDAGAVAAGPAAGEDGGQFRQRPGGKGFGWPTATPAR